jgi:OOP family OmpA-OmpF porin
MSDKVLTALGILGLILLWFFCAGAPRQPAPPPAAVSAPAPSARLAAVFADGKVVVEGTVPDEATRVRLLDRARQTYGDRLVDRVAVDPKVAELGWFGSAAALAPVTVRDLAQGRAEFDGKTLVLTGEVGSPSIRDAIAQAARQQAGPDVAIDNRLTVAAPAVQKRKLDELLAGKTIEFESASAVITPRGRALLDQIVPVIQEDASTRIEVAGHTDSTGGAAENQALSEARAAATLEYLVSRGVARERLSARGYGASKPVADNATAEGRHKNRRIEFQVQGRS